MAKEIIRFKGLSLNRDEQSAAHGELALCAGVELHDGALRSSVLEGSTVEHALLIGSNVATLKYVHETPSYRHFIGQIGEALYWFTADGSPGNNGTVIHTFNGVISIKSVGNTLIVMDSAGVHYVLWKSADEGYKYLGTDIPFVDMKFRPSEQLPGTYDTSTIPDAPAELRSMSAWRALAMDADEVVTIDTDPETNKKMVYIKGENRTAFTEGIWALVNQTNSTIAKDGHFYAPFIIRYCYRLYDGSMVMHSAPIFMNVSSPRTYRVYFNNAWYQRDAEHIYINDQTITIHDGDKTFDIVDQVILCYAPNNVGIRYSTVGSDTNNAALNSLKEDWSDIVKSIDIFVSPMMSREKNGEQIQTARVEKGDLGIRDSYLKELKTTRWAEYPSGITILFDLNVEFDIPMEEEAEYLQRLKDCSTFYKIKSFDIETDTIGTNGAYADLDYDKNAIANISTNELMKDDYHTHNKLLPITGKDSGMYVYNHRVNLYGMKERLFDGFNLVTMINELDISPAATAPHPDTTYIWAIVVELSTDSGKMYVSKTLDYDVREYSICNSLLFYPDQRATRMMIYFSDTMLTLKMEPCNFLNGAMATELFYKTALPPRSARSKYPIVNSQPLPNKIFTSEVDNPYFFPLEGRNTVGMGNIRGVAAVTRALSQGQVGSHDLMVFSSDGIWVMKVSAEGTYSSIHNISREVCSNPKSICQLDQSVVFATERGLSLFRESDERLISEVLDGPVPKWSTLLPLLTDSFPANGTPVQRVISRLLNFGTPAIDMFNQGQVFYDYNSSRVIVLPDTTEESAALVYGLRDDAWSTMPIPAILSVVPGYPSPFVQKSDGSVLILDKPYHYDDEADFLPGLIITRTLTFSDTMDVIRGYTQYGDSTIGAELFFFGSNDQRTWQPLGTSARWFQNYMPGKPFRFFRIAIHLSMKPSEEYQQLQLDVVNKYAKL